jgi:filamentous hemagglutinin family protein
VFKALSPWFEFSLCILGYFCVNNNPASAQVTSDDTVNTQVTENGNTAEITGGETRGDNLFHSFQDFSVETGNEASFLNANDISNIFSRVTGGNISNIDGLISANGSANLFLINPAGIVFGGGARLDIGGSFYGSSASSILFEDGEFSAADLENPPLLTINAPIGLGFRDQPGDIVNRSDGLAVGVGKNIALVGGNVTFIGGNIFAPKGRIELGGLTESGIIGLTEDNNLSFPDAIARGDVSLTDSSSVSVSPFVDDTAQGQAGNIELNTASLTVNNGSRLFADGGTQTKGGNVTINATEDVSFANVSFVNVIGAEGGSIQLDAKSLLITASSFFNGISRDSGFAEAQSGDININLAEDLVLDGLQNSKGGTSISNTSPGIGNPGNIDINARNITFKNGGNVGVYNTSLQDDNVGEITLNARGNILFDGIGRTSFRSGISNSLPDGGSGTPGAINVQAQNLTLTNGAAIASNISGTGDSGDINIEVADAVRVNGFGNVSLDSGSKVLESTISSNVFPTGTGNGGKINIDTQSLELSQNGGINAINSGQGNGGDININAEQIEIGQQGNSSILQSYIQAQTLLESEGNGGNITINTGSLFISDGGNINVGSFSGVGSGGNIKINARDTISVDGGAGIAPDSSILANALNSVVGNAGNIEIETAKLAVTNGAYISANAGTSEDTTKGNGGDITILATDSVDVSGAGGITADVSGENSTGNGGDLNIKTGKLTVKDEARISAILSGNGNAGNINIDTQSLELSQNAYISTITFPKSEGNGGNISINTGSLVINDGGIINVAVAGIGNGGNIKINARDTASVDGGTGTLSGGGIFAYALDSVVGNAGNIEIETAKLSVTNGAFISADILGDNTTGNGGDIVIRTTDSVDISGSGGITADVGGENSTANGGNLTLETGRLTVEDGATISATSFGNGNAGSLTINATESIALTGFTKTRRNGIFANALRGSGNGGDINIVTNDLTIADGAVITASNFPSLEDSVPAGTGQPGNINIQANSIGLENGGRIVATTQSAIGEGANINLQVAENITLQDNSFISARAFGDANGGNLKIDSEFIVAFAEGNNDIIANASQGQGGNITINAESLFGIEERPLNESTNDINASSNVFGLDGTINIDTSDINPVQGATELPSNVVEPEQTTAQACSASGGTANNGLAIAGKGGVPPAPDTPLNSENIISSEQNPAAFAIPEPIETSQGKIQPARGIKVSKSGKISLTAYRTNNAGERIPEIKPNCN